MSPISHRLVGVLLAVSAVLLVLSSCKPEREKDESLPVAPSRDSAAERAGVEAAPIVSSSSVAALADVGTSVPIAAGVLKAGSRCQDIPRVRENEPLDETINMGEFHVDLYPYPNDPTKQALVNVTQKEAEDLCAKRGKRLCTELEWERACKGSKNTAFPWGEAFKADRCPGRKDLAIGQQPNCISEFGVRDMQGVVIEWTASPWERGTSSGDVVVRGSRPDKVSWLSARCTHTRQRSPHQKFSDVGFRCCSGTPNPAKVELRPRKEPTVVEEPDIDTAFQMTLLNAMPKDHRGIVGVELGFDKAYRWHPVLAEEMTVARWVGRPQSGPRFYEIAVFKICGDHAWRAATMRGPVESIGKPQVGTSPHKLSFEVSTGNEQGSVTLGYWHGSVKLTEPEWVREGPTLESGKTPKKLMAKPEP